MTVSQPYTTYNAKSKDLDKAVNLICFLSSNCNEISKEHYGVYLTL